MPAALSNAQRLSTTFLTTSLTLPFACWASPFVSWASPFACISRSPVALPAAWRVLPANSFAFPLILSDVLPIKLLLHAGGNAPLKSNLRDIPKFPKNSPDYVVELSSPVLYITEASDNISCCANYRIDRDTEIDIPGTMDKLEPARCVGEEWPDCKMILISGRGQVAQKCLLKAVAETALFKYSRDWVARSVVRAYRPDFSGGTISLV